MAERASMDLNDSEGEKSPGAAESGSSPPHRKTTSVDLTTAMGSTLDRDEHRTLVGDSKESEENIKDILTSKISELETKLKQTDEYYEKLTKEVSAVRALYDKEREECEDVVSVAKRNIEGQVSKILELQRKKRELANKIVSEEEKLDKEEERTRIELKEEEDRLTRNVAILQTKLLINEGIKFERDQLLTKIEALETDLVEKEKFYQLELSKAKAQIQEKYDRLFRIARNRQETIAEQVKNLSLRQQIAALKCAQKQIMRTQSAYKKASKKMLHLMDQNRILSERNHSVEVQVAIQQSLVDATLALEQEFQKDKKVKLKRTPKEKLTEVEETTEDLMEPIRNKIEDLKNQLYRFKDEETDLNDILEDQRSYLNVVRNQKQILHDVEQRLIPLSDIAEYIAQKGRVVMKKDFENPAIRYDMFQKLSAILTESDQLQKYLTPTEQEGVYQRRKDGIDSLPPLQETLRSKQRKTSDTNTSDFSAFNRRLNPVEEKILSDLGLLGKYGTKRKKILSF